MARPQPQPSLAKAPSKGHPLAPASTSAVEPSTRQAAVTRAAAAAPQEAEMAMFSTRLDAGLRRQLKVHAAERGQTIQEVTEAALRSYLQGNTGH